MLEVLEPKNLKLKPHHNMFVNMPGVLIGVSSSKKDLTVHQCYKVNFYYQSYDKILELTFNNYKVFIKLDKQQETDFYFVLAKEISFTDCSYIVLGVFDGDYEVSEDCKLKYKNIEIEIKKLN
jgi:hypothetical protein